MRPGFKFAREVEKTQLAVPLDQHDGGDHDSSPAARAVDKVDDGRLLVVRDRQPILPGMTDGARAIK